MNAQPQFIRNPFQAYYTGISTTLSLLGTATRPLLAPGPGRGEEDVRRCDFRLRCPTPERISARLLCCFPCVVSTLWGFIWAGNLHPFEVTAAVCARESACWYKGGRARACTQHGCLPNAERTAGQLFSVKGTNREKCVLNI